MNLFSLDKNIFYFINSHHNKIFDWFFYLISLVGEYGLIWIILAFVLLFVLKKNGKKIFLLMISALVLTLIFDDIIKLFYFRVRPYLALTNVHQVGKMWLNGSFPSGHASSVFAMLIVVGGFFKKAFVPILICALLTIYSRVYLGMHFPIDVLTGAIIGIVCGFIVLLIYRRGFEKNN